MGFPENGDKLEFDHRSKEWIALVPKGETIDRPIAGPPTKPLRADLKLDILFQLILLRRGGLRSKVITSAGSAPPGAEPHLPRLSLSRFPQRRATCQPIGRRQAQKN